MSEHKIARYKSKDSSKSLHLPPQTKKNIKNDPFLKELDDGELYEWGHLKLLKSNRLLKKKKNIEVMELLRDIVDGIDSKAWDSMKERIAEEIKLPAMKKLRSLLLSNKNYQEALEITEKVRGGSI